MNSEIIWKCLEEKQKNWSYPESVRNVKKNDRNKNAIFFPIGSGLIDKRDFSSSIPAKSIIFLGQDFGDEYYISEKLKQDESKFHTIRNLLSFIKEEEREVLSSKCFFTNSYYGIRKGGGKANMTKKINWESVQDESVIFFEKIIIEKLNPSKIVLLGNKVVSFFNKITRTEKSVENFKDELIRRQEEKNPYIFNGICLFYLPHPSMLPRNALYYPTGRRGIENLLRDILV